MIFDPYFESYVNGVQAPTTPLFYFISLMLFVIWITPFALLARKMGRSAFRAILALHPLGVFLFVCLLAFTTSTARRRVA